MEKQSAEARETRDFKERLAEVLPRVIAAVSLIALIPSAWLSVRERVWSVLAGDLLSSAWVLLLALVPSIPYKVKVLTLVLLPYALGVLLIWETGPYGAGHIYIFAFVFFAALFGSTKSIILANGLAVLTHVAFALARAVNLVKWEQDLDSVIVISSNFVLVSVILSFSAHYLIDRYAKAASEERKAQAELETMLHEIEHREKNNIQVISSLVNLKSRPGVDPARAIEEIKASLSAISAVQHLLYRRDAFRIVDARSLVEELVARYRLLHVGMTWRCSWEGEKAELDGDRAVDLGLLINEIVTNSLKHGFPNGATGVIFVESSHDADARRLSMRIGDEGIGRRSSGSADGGIGAGVRGTKGDEGGGHGLKIVEAIARHLGAKMELEEGPGWVYRIGFDVG